MAEFRIEDVFKSSLDKIPIRCPENNEFYSIKDFTKKDRKIFAEFLKLFDNGDGKISNEESNAVAKTIGGWNDWAHYKSPTNNLVAMTESMKDLKDLKLRIVSDRGEYMPDSVLFRLAEDNDSIIRKIALGHIKHRLEELREKQKS